MVREFERGIMNGPQPANTIPVTLNVTALYTNIPLQEGIDIFKIFLDSREEKTVPTSFLICLLTLVLTCNIFVFDNVF